LPYLSPTGRDASPFNARTGTLSRPPASLPAASPRINALNPPTGELRRDSRMPSFGFAFCAATSSLCFHSGGRRRAAIRIHLRWFLFLLHGLWRLCSSSFSGSGHQRHTRMLQPAGMPLRDATSFTCLHRPTCCVPFARTFGTPYRYLRNRLTGRWASVKRLYRRTFTLATLRYTPPMLARRTGDMVATRAARRCAARRTSWRRGPFPLSGPGSDHLPQDLAGNRTALSSTEHPVRA